MIELAAIEEEVAAPIEAIWAIVSDFAHPRRLAPTIDRVETRGEGVGAVRIVYSSRGLIIHEKLLARDPARHLLRYAVIDSGDMPFAHVTRYECTISLDSLEPHRTRIGWRSAGAVDGPVAPIREFLNSLYRNANRQIVDQVAGATHTQ